MLTRLVEAARLLGPRVAWVAPMWLVRRRYLVLIRDLRGSPPPAPPPPATPGLRRSVLNRADQEALLRADPALRSAEIERRLAEGQECLLYWSGSVLVHYRWETTSSAFLPYLDLTLRLLPGDACTTWVYTHPAARGSGVLTYSSADLLHRLRSQGVRRSLALVAWWNEPSLRVTRDRAGRSVVGSVDRWHLGPVERLVASGAVRLDGEGGFYVQDPSQD